MIYTVRYAHLAERPLFPVGKIIRRGDVVGTMGSTGKSTGAHLHIDCVEGMHTSRYTLADIEKGKPLPAARQLNLFIDKELFDIKPEITTYYCDYRYQIAFGKIHPAYDLVPIDRNVTKQHHNIRWNRSMPGRVTHILDDPAGYGHCLYIAFDA
jgi:hypothetical protein